MLAVHDDSVTASIENPGGTVVIVEVIVSEPEDDAAAPRDIPVGFVGVVVVVVAAAVGRVIDDFGLAAGRVAVAGVGCPSNPIESAGNVKGGGRIMSEDGYGGIGMMITPSKPLPQSSTQGQIGKTVEDPWLERLVVVWDQVVRFGTDIKLELKTIGASPLVIVVKLVG